MDSYGTVGEFMKRLFCRPYRTNTGVHALFPSSKLLGYYQLPGPDAPNPDVNGDGVVDFLDLVLVAKHFGEA
jgi:hypothetical protein